MFAQLPVITNAAIEKILKYKDLIPAIEQALSDFSKGDVSQPVRQTTTVAKHSGWVFKIAVYELCPFSWLWSF